MKYLILVTVALFFVATSSCNQSAPKSNSTDSTATGESIVTYSGTLPCADCSGIFTKLTLTTPENGRGTFRMTETYQGTKNGDQAFNSEGSYVVAGDSGNVIITLNPEKDKNLRRHFQKFSDTELRMLDGDQNAIQSNLNYSLKKQ